MSSRSHHAKSRADRLAIQESELDFIGEPGDCDVCGRPLGGETFFSDAELAAHGGRWGVLCRTCTVTEGVRPGWGRAQFYERQPISTADAAPPFRADRFRWRCVAGKPPPDLMRDG